MAELAKLGKGPSWLNQRSGVSRATIANWEKQPKPPQAGTVAAVADVLGISREEAAQLAGLPADILTAPPKVDLSEASDEDLVAEVLRRMKRGQASA